MYALRRLSSTCWQQQVLRSRGEYVCPEGQGHWRAKATVTVDVIRN